MLDEYSEYLEAAGAKLQTNEDICAGSLDEMKQQQLTYAVSLGFFINKQ